MSNAPLPRPRHLLVRLPNPLGDAVMATPALRALRRALPEVRITWAGGRAAHAVLEGLPYRDDVVPLAGRFARGALAPVRAGKLLRGLGADTALLLPNSWSSALAMRAARVPVRVGSALKRRGLLLTHKVELPLAAAGKLEPRAMTAHYMDLVAPFGGRADERRTELAATAFDEERAERRLGTLAAGARLLGVNPGAAFADTKVYPPEHIAAAVARIVAATDVYPIVFCGPGEEELAQRVAQVIGSRCLSLHESPPSLGELKALLRRLELLLTTDTGPRHIAEAFDVPTVVWMGPTDPRWSEGGPAQVVRNESLTCLGCHRKRCPIGIACMRDLEPEAVATAALEVLRG